VRQAKREPLLDSGAEGLQAMLLTGNGRRLTWAVATVIVLVSAAGLLLRLLALDPGVAAALADGRPAVFVGYPLLLPLVDVDGEGNLPAWLSSVVLLVSALLLWGVAVATRSIGDPWHRHWSLLAFAFGYLSLDEGAQVHERLLMPVGALLTESRGIFTFGWVLVAAPVLAGFGVMYLRFVWALPVALRRLVVLAAVLYVGGALGMELVGGWVLDGGSSEASVPYVLVTSAEELLEMAGLTVFLHALVRTQRELPLSALGDGAARRPGPAHPEEPEALGQALRRAR